MLGHSLGRVGVEYFFDQIILPCLQAQACEGGNKDSNFNEGTYNFCIEITYPTFPKECHIILCQPMSNLKPV